MKIPARFFVPRALLALFLTFAFEVTAQEAPAVTEKPSAPAVTPANAEAASPPAAEAEVAPVAPPTPSEAVTSPAPAAPETVSGSAESGPATTTPTAAAAEKSDEPEAEQKQDRRHHGHWDGSEERPFGDHTIAKGSHAHHAVSVFGSTTVEGEAGSDAVSVFGDTRIGRDGEVHGAAVAVMGALNVQGRVQGDAVNVMGDATIDNHVGGQVVAVFSDLHLGSNAVIDGDIVLVGGELTRDPNAVVKGNHVRMPILSGFGNLDGLASWITHCLLWGRPLAFAPNLGWAWAIALTFLALYVIFALLFRTGIDQGVRTLETHPGSTIVTSLLTVLLLPVLTVLLVLTVIGGVVVPFLGIALFFAGIFGKAVVLAWIGRRVTNFFGDGPLNHPAVAVIVGGLIVLGLYVVPILGFVMYKLLGVLGLGVVVYTLILRSQREKVRPAIATSNAPSATIPAPVVTEPPPTMSAGFSSVPPSRSDVPAASIAGLPPPVIPAVPLNTLPRAGFWIRMGALALDVVLIGVILSFAQGVLPRILRFDNCLGALLSVLAIYGAVLWKLKGTTIGGIICGLKVVRVDGRELDWATTIVRALGCFLSLVVAGLGFIWVVIDDDKQSWHDKIAGTTVVRTPKGTALV